MKVWRDIRYRIEYAGILIPYRLIRLLPYPVVRGLGLLIGNAMNLVPMIRKVVRANIHAAMPEHPALLCAAARRHRAAQRPCRTQ